MAAGNITLGKQHLLTDHLGATERHLELELILLRQVGRN